MSSLPQLKELLTMMEAIQAQEKKVGQLKELFANMRQQLENTGNFDLQLADKAMNQIDEIIKDCNTHSKNVNTLTNDCSLDKVPEGRQENSSSEVNSQKKSH